MAATATSGAPLRRRRAADASTTRTNRAIGAQWRIANAPFTDSATNSDSTATSTGTSVGSAPSGDCARRGLLALYHFTRGH